jgi:hypothetical protein
MNPFTVSVSVRKCKCRSKHNLHLAQTWCLIKLGVSPHCQQQQPLQFAVCVGVCVCVCVCVCQLLSLFIVTKKLHLSRENIFIIRFTSPHDLEEVPNFLGKFQYFVKHLLDLSLPAYENCNFQLKSRFFWCLGFT